MMIGFGMSKFIVVFGLFLITISGSALSQDFNYEDLDGLEQYWRDEACSIDQHDKTSTRLEELYDKDQAARTDPSIDFDDVPLRIEVSQIFAEGCLKTGADFFYSSVIFQHGNIPEHYKLALEFAERAVMLGDHRGQFIIPVAIDRYLSSIGQKQLFGTQRFSNYYIEPEKEYDTPYFCLWPIADDFPDSVRNRYRRPSLNDLIERYMSRKPETDPFEGVICPIEVDEPDLAYFEKFQ